MHADCMHDVGYPRAGAAQQVGAWQFGAAPAEQALYFERVVPRERAAAGQAL